MGQGLLSRCLFLPLCYLQGIDHFPFPKAYRVSNQWISWAYGSLEPKLLELDKADGKIDEDGEYYPIKSFASKAPEQVLRIVALFAFLSRRQVKKLINNSLQRKNPTCGFPSFDTRTRAIR